MKCSGYILVKNLNKQVPCLRGGHHGGFCRPDLTGLKFNYLTVLRLAQPIKGKTRWVVEQCGQIREVYAFNLLHNKDMGVKYRGGFSNTVEYRTVVQHRARILGTRADSENYKGMPFYPEWNSDTEDGALWKGAKWIVENLGKHPGPQWSMDIIEHAKGFWPGNLRWAMHNQQSLNKQHRILGQFSDEEFAVEARRRGYIKKDT